MSAKNFVSAVFGFSFILVLCYIGLFFYQLKADVSAEKWIANTYEYKDYIGHNISSPKVIVISGSNALFGLNSELLEEKEGLPVLNLAVHAGLDLDYLYYKISKHIKEGDTVIMPLEYSYYSSQGISEWYVNNMLVWGGDYLSSLPLAEQLQFFVNVSPKRLLAGVVGRLKDGRYEPLPQGEVVKKLQGLIQGEGVKWRGYSFKSLNLYGDINVDELEYFEGNESYIKTSSVSDYFLKTFYKIERLVEKYHGKLILTHPVTFRNKEYDLSRQDSQNRVLGLVEELRQLGIQIRCRPEAFHLNKSYSFNAKYHPNKYGAALRTISLGECLFVSKESFTEE